MEREVGVNWAATFSQPGPGGTVAIVYCYEFVQGGRSWGDVCTRCGTKQNEHVEPGSEVK